MVRQMHALQQAIPQAQVKVAETEVAIVAECCRNLEPVAQEFQQDVLDAMTALVAALQKEAVFYRHVATMGWTESLRPAHWALMPVGNNLAFRRPRKQFAVPGGIRRRPSESVGHPRERK